MFKLNTSVSKTWFYNLFGFEEENYNLTQSSFNLISQIIPSGKKLFILKSKINNREFPIGNFETPSLEELRKKVLLNYVPTHKSLVENIIVDDILELHGLSVNKGAMFQVASQFNCLEFITPDEKPENGITKYQWDNTQGPACSLACATATVYRNYFTQIKNNHITENKIQIGQTNKLQINNLEDILKVLGNNYITVKNGYTFSSEDKLILLNNKLKNDYNLCENIKKNLRIGVHYNIGVTFDKFNRKSYPQNASFKEHKNGHLISQAFCSGISVAYSGLSQDLWEPFSILILQASYEATLWAAVLNSKTGGSNKVFLTFIGGGAYGNDIKWILDAMANAIVNTSDYGLDIKICHYININNKYKDYLQNKIFDLLMYKYKLLHEINELIFNDVVFSDPKWNKFIIEKENVIATYNLKYIINFINERGQTLLYLAARKCNKILVDILLENGALINAFNKDGSTPLIGLLWGYIIEKREKKILPIIIKTKVIELYNYMKSKGADDEIPNLRGETAQLFYKEI
jgi:hypothetical protein